MVVFTVGYRNRFGHPKEAVMARYRELGSQLYRTDESGALSLHFENTQGVTLQSYRSQNRRYWRE